jgi:deoxyribonuclease V
MIACVDTWYSDVNSITAVVLFEKWSDEVAKSEFVHDLKQPAADYVPGQFFRRELPSILAAIRAIDEKLDAVIIDGYVWLDDQKRKGLGAILYDELEGFIPIIGVAKTKFVGSTGIEVFRGNSRRPLIVTSAGMDNEEAASHVQSMAGGHRIPKLLKRVDYLSRHSCK